MENLQTKFDIDGFVQALRDNDSRAEALERDFRSYLQKKYGGSNTDIYHRLAMAYKDAGLKEKAKDLLYTAQRYAEDEGKPELAQMIQKEAHELPGQLD